MNKKAMEGFGERRSVSAERENESINRQLKEESKE
jgi:hypothetical protein